MRVLHTSDWHLGAQLYHASRDEEHRRFLAWLDRTIRARDVEVLVVAGDVFHYLQPSSDALQIYYDFLAGVRDAPSLRRVVVVGGNHDSAARLDAPRPLLGALGVDVVGGYTRDSAGDCICPIVGDTGEVELVVVAVPYVHEYRLGVRTTGRDPYELAADLRAEFRALYSQLADAARAAYPDVPLVATGHLTCRGALEDDYGTPIHQVNTTGGLDPNVFDARYDYVALGHIHRCYAVDSESPTPRVWYAGTPVSVSSKEQNQRQVLLLDTGAAGEIPAVEKLNVPCERPIVRIEAEVDDARATLAALEWSGDLRPYVVATILTREPLAYAARQLEEATEGRAEADRPVIVHVTERRVFDAPEDREAPAGGAAPRLADLTPEEVFVRLHAQKRDGAAPADALLIAFRSLLSEENA